MDNLFSLERFYLLFRVATLVSIVIGLIGLIIFLNYRTKNLPKLKTLGIVLFGQMWVCAVCLSMVNNIFQKKAQKELRNKLSARNLILSICNKKLDKNESEDMRQLLVGIKNISRHHSTPTYCGNIEFRYLDENIELRIERDNSIKSEYWIYWDKYVVTKDNPVGYLRTDKLDKMNCP